MPLQRCLRTTSAIGKAQAAVLASASAHWLRHTAGSHMTDQHLGGAPRKHAEIALMLGFCGPSAFSRWFRTQFGRPATAWQMAPNASGIALGIAEHSTEVKRQGGALEKARAELP